MARRSGRQKLVGWGAFAAMLVIVVAIILVIRMQGGAQPAPAASSSPSVAQASSPSAAALADALSAAAASRAAASDASVASVAANPASSSGPASSAASSALAPSASSAAALSEPEVEVVDARTMSQQSRRGLLLTLIQQGVFSGVEALGTPPKVGVTTLFQGLSPSLQLQFIAVVYAYINNGAAGTATLQLIDATNGNQVGSYSASDGLKLSQG